MNEVQDSAKEHSPAVGLFTRFFRWLFCWRMVSRCLFALACLATLAGLFYAVENWRGKRAWEECRRELEAKGAVIDWKALIPGPVSNDQNIFRAPRIAEWFVKGSAAAPLSGGASKSPDTNAPFALSPGADAKREPLLVAEVVVVPANGPLPSEKADAVLRFDDPAAREQAAKLLREAIGPCAEDPRNGVVVARPLDHIKPVHVVLQTGTDLTANALRWAAYAKLGGTDVIPLAEFFPRSPVPHSLRSSSDLYYFQVDSAGSNSFQISLKPPVYAATEYLALSQPAVPDLEVLRQALERPCARMDSDYEHPFERPLPNFVRMRTVAQMLSQRAQCYLLLGQSADAWHELSLVRGLCHMLEAKPASDCPTLVEAMISVAITGLYTQVIADGLRLQAWREPELAAIQKQLADANLLRLVRAAFNAERAASCRTLEAYPRTELCRLFAYRPGWPGLLEELKDPVFLFVSFVPRGWFYQNMCTDAILEELVTGSIDVANDQVLPTKADDIGRQLQSIRGAFRPYTFLTATVTPNFLKAEQTLARNQTLANEALVACGLERYRLAHGQYPETLEALVPQFADKVPHDIVGGQPLKYHRTADGRFVLYSIGWNEKDDGGVPGKSITEGDWVWP